MCVGVLALASCYYSYPNKMDHWVPTEVGRIDSVDFKIAHHYWKGENFYVWEGLQLLKALPLLSETGTMERGWWQTDTVSVAPRTEVVVVDVAFEPTQGENDSVWVCVAADRLTQGWVRESTLLEGAVPDAPISKAIYYFSSRRSKIFMSCGALAMGVLAVGYAVRRKRWTTVWRFVRRNGVGGSESVGVSLYPSLLLLSVGVLSAVYGSIQAWVPETWVEYYFHPTLNPFAMELPWVMRLFVGGLWALVVVGLAVALDALRRYVLGKALLRLSMLMCGCIVVYLVFTLSMQIYVGYVLLPTYFYVVLHRYRCRCRAWPYECGACGAAMKRLGRCEQCGAENY